MTNYLNVVKKEGDEPIQLPLEQDSTLLLTSLQSLVPNAIGLKFHSENGFTRGVRLSDGKFYPPEDGWQDNIFTSVVPKGEKRKVQDARDGPSKKSSTTSDLIILGLAWKTTEQQVRSYFEAFGEVTMVTVKMNQNGLSKGFGFVRFRDPVVQTKVIAQRHFIDGRWCDVKIPNRKPTEVPQDCKIFVGQLTTDITAVELREYFSRFGEVADIFIPQPFRQFAFVTFKSAKDAATVCNSRNHSINGIPINVSVAMPLTKHLKNKLPAVEPQPQLDYSILTDSGLFFNNGQVFRPLINAPNSWISASYAGDPYSWLKMFPNHLGS